MCISLPQARIRNTNDNFGGAHSSVLIVVLEVLSQGWRVREKRFNAAGREKGTGKKRQGEDMKEQECTIGVPVVAQWLTNPTRNHEVAGLIPALAQRVQDPALP